MRFFDIQNILTIKVEVGVATRSRRLWLITLSETLITLDISKN